MSEGYERGRLFNTALLAGTLADQRRIDEAAAVATEALRMARTIRSARSKAYLADVANKLSPSRDDSAVKSLYDQMRKMGVPTPGTK